MISELDSFIFNSFLFKEGIALGIFSWLAFLLVMLLIMRLIRTISYRGNVYDI